METNPTKPIMSTTASAIGDELKPVGDASVREVDVSEQEENATYVRQSGDE